MYRCNWYNHTPFWSHTFVSLIEYYILPRSHANHRAALFYFSCPWNLWCGREDSLVRSDCPMQLLQFFSTIFVGMGRNGTQAAPDRRSLSVTVYRYRGTIVLYTRLRHNATWIPRVFISVNGIPRHTTELSFSSILCISYVRTVPRD